MTVVLVLGSLVLVPALVYMFVLFSRPPRPDAAEPEPQAGRIATCGGAGWPNPGRHTVERHVTAAVKSRRTDGSGRSRGSVTRRDESHWIRHQFGHPRRRTRGRRGRFRRPSAHARRRLPLTSTADLHRLPCTAVVTVPPLPLCRRRFREAQNAMPSFALPVLVPSLPAARRPAGFADRLHPRRLGVRHAHIGVRVLPAPPGRPVAAVPRRRRARRRMRHRPVLRAGAQPDRGGGRDRRRRRLARDARHGRPPGGRPWLAQRPARAGADRGGRAARRRGPRAVLRHPRRAAVHGAAWTTSSRTSATAARWPRGAASGRRPGRSA